MTNGYGDCVYGVRSMMALMARFAFSITSWRACSVSSNARASALSGVVSVAWIGISANTASGSLNGFMLSFLVFAMRGIRGRSESIQRDYSLIGGKI